MSDKLKNKLRDIRMRLFSRDSFNDPVMIALMDAAAKLAPNASKNEARTREHDRAAIAAGDPGAPVIHEPGLVDGRARAR